MTNSTDYSFSLSLKSERFPRWFSSIEKRGIFTHHTLWKEGSLSQSSNGPLSLHVKTRLWPWLRKEPHQHFTVVAAYQHELRMGPFDGPNQLGLLTDAAVLRIAASGPLWPVRRIPTA